jgi:hypothetical protein
VQHLAILWHFLQFLHAIQINSYIFVPDFYNKTGKIEEKMKKVGVSVKKRWV